MLPVHQIPNGLGYVLALVGITNALVHYNFLSERILGPHVFLELFLVVGNQDIGGFDNALGTTVVLLQFIERSVGVVLLKIKNIADVGASKRINTLGVVAHHTNVLKARSQGLHDQVLCVVGILILIH